jgi:hypothetical protein
MNSRYQDWPERLAAFIEERRYVPFTWGTNDCCIFAADAMLAITGRDFADGMRNYSTELGAARIIKEAGGMRELVKGLKQKPVGFANRGDLVLCDAENGETFGICFGDGLWCGAARDGIGFRSMKEAILAWGV